MFWKKCGKIIKEGGSLFDCDSSPCPYYALFGLKYRDLDDQTMEPIDECSWNYEVLVFAVKDRKIIWNDECISVIQKTGECGYKKIRSGCYTECVQYGDTGCLIEEERCPICLEVYVYNITGCYDNLDDFNAAVYGPCGAQPDENGIYKEPEDNFEKESCLEEWKKKFLDEYALTFKIEFKNYEQLWEVYGRGEIWDTYEMWECNCGDGYYFSYDEPCPDGCDSVYLGRWEGDIEGYGPTATRLENDRNYKDGKYDFVNIVFVPYQGAPTCCEANSIRSHIGEAGSHMFSYADDEDAYNYIGSKTESCTASNKLCFDFSYKSAAYDNYYGSYDSVRYRFSWKGLLLVKTPDTPLSAKGIKFKAKIKKIRKNEGYDVDLDETIEETEEAILLTFGEEYKDLPLATNLTTPKYLSVFECSDDCWGEEGDYPHFEPFPIKSWYGIGPWKHDNYTEEYQIKLIAESYF